MNDDINVIGLVKGEQRFIFLFPDDRKHEVINRISGMAANSDIDFSWYDAAVLTTQVRSITS